jgi:phosphoribosyl 1,2-cyclic phosphodiesterase
LVFIHHSAFIISRMSLDLSILASGSMGNCSVLRTPGGIALIDCGIGPRTAAARMKDLGVSPLDISAICLTHLDRDHFNPNWTRTIINRQILVHCHQSRAGELCGRVQDDRFHPLIRAFDGDAFDLVAGLSCSTIALAHDREGSHGFMFEGFGSRVGYATDLGRVTDALIRKFQQCDIVALESNYDPLMQEQSGRPLFLRQRITGGRGHLSNQQAFDALRQILDQSRQMPRHIVLLHRSRQCNCPRLVRELFSRDARIAPRLTLAEQHQRTDWLQSAQRPAFVGTQLELAFG